MGSAEQFCEFTETLWLSFSLCRGKDWEEEYYQRNCCKSHSGPPNGPGIELRPGRRLRLECLVSAPQGYQIPIEVSSRTSAPIPCWAARLYRVESRVITDFSGYPTKGVWLKLLHHERRVRTGSLVKETHIPREFEAEAWVIRRVAKHHHDRCPGCETG